MLNDGRAKQKNEKRKADAMHPENVRGNGCRKLHSIQRLEKELEEPAGLAARLSTQLAAAPQLSAG
jgi:hypothetical protein